MVAPRFRSRSRIRKKRKTPGGRVVTHYNKRKSAKPQCGMCGEYLKGVAAGSSSVIRKLAKTQRRPERPYGGVLCSRCTRKVIVEKARAMAVQNG